MFDTVLPGIFNVLFQISLTGFNQLLQLPMTMEKINGLIATIIFNIYLFKPIALFAVVYFQNTNNINSPK